jgi:hypothetical protein
MIRRALKRAGGVTFVSALAAAGLALAGGQAHASNPAIINQWSPASTCIASPYHLCLWYAPGRGTGGAGWGTSAVGIHTITGTFFMDGNPNNEGIGSPVRNNAASMSDGSPQCSDVVWTLPNGEGLGDELWQEYGGNLDGFLRNNEASTEIDC